MTPPSRDGARSVRKNQTRSFWFQATIKRRGVRIVVEAKDEAEARREAERGRWMVEDTSGSELADWEINRLEPEE